MSDFFAVIAGGVFGLIYFNELYRIGETIGQCIGTAILNLINGDAK
jgi:hypothetical protein